MKKILFITLLTLLANQAMAEHLLIKGGFFIRDVNVVSRQGDVIEYQIGDSSEVYKIHVEYIDRVSELLPTERKELTPKNIQQHLKAIEQQAKADKIIQVHSLEAACDLYNANKKDPYLAAGLSTFVPSLGHAYAGDWERGRIFIVLEALLVGSLFIPVEDSQVFAIRGMAVVWGGFLIKSIEVFDAVNTADDYNEQLRKDLKIDLGVDERGIRLDLKF